MIVRPVSPRDDPELASTLLAVQHAAYAREAELIADDRIPALHEDVDDLCAARLRWLAAFVDEELAGAIGWAETHDDHEVVPGLWITRYVRQPAT